MNTCHGLTMRDLIDENQLVTAQQMMGHLLSISIVTIDADGNAYGGDPDSNPPCPLSSLPARCGSPCMKSKSVLQERIASSPRTQICECRMGISNCISPVIAENVYLGAVVIGHFVIAGTAPVPPEIASLTSSLPVLPEEYLPRLLGYGDFISGYFSELAAKRITERKLLAETCEKLRYAEEVQQTQLKTLSAQINPHFLFNTLNSITRMAFLEDAQNTQEMTYCLSDLLRYNLKQTEEFPTIGSEIDNIRRYLHIQDIRYKDRIHHHIDISSQITDCRIPSMLLQPIVENAIIHGLEPKIEGGSIFITSETSNNRIKIRIRDTGVGIQAKRLKDFLTDGVTSAAGLGIHNSHQRLQRYFGADYGLKITSHENVETVVEITLPYFKELAPARHN